jgi:hypothetical protein
MPLNTWTDGLADETLRDWPAHNGNGQHANGQNGHGQQGNGQNGTARLVVDADAPQSSARVAPDPEAEAQHANGHGAAQLVAPVLVTGRVRDRRELRPTERLSVSLVIPAKNEARNLPYVLDHLPGGIDEVILVDGRSSDVTTVMARHCLPDIRIISEPGSGKGNALRAGFAAATGDAIVAMDADGSMSPEEIPHYVYFLEQGYDLVKGSRFVAGGGSLDITSIRRLGNYGLLKIANALFGSQYSDLCYGFFAFRRHFLEHLALRSTGFEIETEIMVRAQVTGLRIAEIPSLELPRRAGGSNLRAVRDGQRVLKTLVREKMRVAEERTAQAQA